MRGTIGMVGVKYGRPDCACTQGVKHRKVHLSVNLHGRTRSCDLWREREALVAPLLREDERAWRLILALTTVNLAVLQADGGLGRLVERQLPSADTLRRFLYAFHNEQ